MNTHRALALSVTKALYCGSAALRSATHYALSAAALKTSGEPFAEDDPELPKIEARAIAGLLLLWAGLRADVFDTLDLTDSGGSKAMKVGEEVFAFDALASLRELLLMQERFILAAGADNGPLVQQAFAAWVRGLENAATEIDAAAVVADARRVYRAQIQARGLQLVRAGAVRTFREDIVQRLISGEYDGLSPKDVARKLGQRFDAGNYNWERLARSETAMAQVDGKRAQYLESGIERVDYHTAKDAKVSSICRGLAAAGPYPTATAPVPVRDSHPNCRCTWRPVLDE